MSSMTGTNSNAITRAFQNFDKSNSSETDLVKNAVDSKIAKTEVAANVSVIRTQDENLGTILDLKA